MMSVSAVSNAASPAGAVSRLSPPAAVTPSRFGGDRDASLPPKSSPTKPTILQRLTAGVKAMGAYFTPADWKAHHYIWPGSLPGDLALGTVSGLLLSIPLLGIGSIATIPAMVVTLIAVMLTSRFMSACGDPTASFPTPSRSFLA